MPDGVLNAWWCSVSIIHMNSFVFAKTFEKSNTNFAKKKKSQFSRCFCPYTLESWVLEQSRNEAIEIAHTWCPFPSFIWILLALLKFLRKVTIPILLKKKMKSQFSRCFCPYTLESWVLEQSRNEAEIAHTWCPSPIKHLSNVLMHSALWMVSSNLHAHNVFTHELIHVFIQSCLLSPYSAQVCTKD